MALLSILLLMSCNPSDEETCIDEMINEFVQRQMDRSFVGISRFVLDGETYYVFDSGVAFDATASVVDESCNQVCIFGGLRSNSPQPCDDFMDGINSAELIWP